MYFLQELWPSVKVIFNIAMTKFHIQVFFKAFLHLPVKKEHCFYQ